MNLLTGLFRFILLGIIIGSLLSLGLLFFAIVSVVLMVLGGLVWLKKNDVLGHPTTSNGFVEQPVPEEVVVEHKVIEADYEEVGRKE